MGKRIYNTEIIKKKLINIGFTPIFEEYRKYKDKYEVECRFGHRIFIRIDHALSGINCNLCNIKARKFDYEHVKKIFEQRGYKLLESEYVNANKKMRMICSNGHKIYKSYSDFIRCKCKRCVSDSYRLSCSDIEDRLKKIDFILISKYENYKTKITVKCNKGHTFDMLPSNIKNKNGCYICNGSANEVKCREYFEKITDKKFTKKRPKWLKNPSSNYPLELDGYNEELKIAFEYNGRQHYEQIKYWNNKKSNKLTITQRNDKFKLKKCREKGILLIVIPYNISNIEEYIKNELKKAGILNDSV
jgi:uncharacterized protein YkuJ